MYRDTEKQFEKYIDLKLTMPRFSGTRWSRYFNKRLKDLSFNLEIPNIISELNMEDEYLNLLHDLEKSLDTPRKVDIYFKELYFTFKDFIEYIDYLDLFYAVALKQVNYLY